MKWHSFQLTLIAAGEVILAVGFTAWMGFGVLDPGRRIDLVALIGTAILFAIALTFSVWNRLGIWWPASESTRDFVGLSIERSRRKLRTLRFCRWFLALEIAFLVPWLSWALLSRQPPATPAKWAEVFGAPLLLSGAILAWSVWYRKRTLRELAEWEALMRSLGEEPSPGSP